MLPRSLRMSPNKGSFFSLKSSDGIREIYKLLYERWRKDRGIFSNSRSVSRPLSFHFAPTKKESHRKEKTMELNHLELAAEIVFELCRQHPELCPHHYEWTSSIQRKDGTTLKRYKCQICGNECTTIRRTTWTDIRSKKVARLKRWWERQQIPINPCIVNFAECGDSWNQ